VLVERVNQLDPGAIETAQEAAIEKIGLAADAPEFTPVNEEGAMGVAVEARTRAC